MGRYPSVAEIAYQCTSPRGGSADAGIMKRCNDITMPASINISGNSRCIKCGLLKPGH